MCHPWDNGGETRTYHPLHGYTEVVVQCLFESDRGVVVGGLR